MCLRLFIRKHSVHFFSVSEVMQEAGDKAGEKKKRGFYCEMDAHFNGLESSREEG